MVCVANGGEQRIMTRGGENSDNQGERHTICHVWWTDEQ